MCLINVKWMKTISWKQFAALHSGSRPKCFTHSSIKNQYVWPRYTMPPNCWHMDWKHTLKKILPLPFFFYISFCIGFKFAWYLLGLEAITCESIHCWRGSRHIQLWSLTWRLMVHSRVPRTPGLCDWALVYQPDPGRMPQNLLNLC